MSRRHGTPIALVAWLCAACSDVSPKGPLMPPDAPTASKQQVDWRQFPHTDRKDTPWQRLSDDALAQAIVNGGGRVLIGLKAASKPAGVDAKGQSLVDSAALVSGKVALKQRGVQFLYEFRRQPAVIGSIQATRDVVASLRSDPFVDYIEPDVRGSFDSQQQTPWNISKVQGPQAWPYSTGSGVKLLILDSGVGPHRDLTLGVQFRCVDGSLPIIDWYGHGTAVAGAAAAVNNSVDVIGVGHGVTLWSANVTDASRNTVSATEVACSIDVARVNGVFAINMSFHILSPTTQLTDAIRGAYQDGIFLAASAGNNGQFGGTIFYPATLAEVVAVAAVDTLNVRAYYSSYGQKIELSAPAEIIRTTALWVQQPQACPPDASGYTGPCNGTSMASPHVAAAAAVLKAYQPSWTNVQIRDQLACTAQYLGDPIYYGNGLIRVRTAMIVQC